MIFFRCPVCGKALSDGEKECRCKNNHSFDKARSGYLNLLLSGASHGHGDDKIMLKSRRAFLEKGYYLPLAKAVCEEVIPRLPENGAVLDAGCGEGYYLRVLQKELADQKKNAALFGVDVSKTAADLSAKSLRGFFAAASVYALPFPDASFDAVLSLFSPHAPREFYRVLKPGALLYRAYPLREHLLGLKEALYENVILKEENETVDPGFEPVLRREVKNRIDLKTNGEIMDLFSMTPYFHKTSPEDRKKLETLSRLSTPVAFGITIWKKV